MYNGALISKSKRAINRKELLVKAKGFKLKESDKQLAIPTHRKKRHMPFEEYQLLLKQGKSIPEIIQLTSKHLIAFYNALLKGRINISKEEFEEMYNKGMSLDKIAKSKGIPREHMTFLREFYGIKRKGAKFLKRINNEQPLSQEAKDIIIGSLLGDGHITKWGYFSEKHSPAQLKYLKWKASFFKSITTDKSWEYYESIDNRSGSLIQTHNFRTTTHNFLYKMRNKFYKETNGKWNKVIPDDIDSLINERILAIWYMDDGSTDWPYRKGVKNYPNSLPTCQICSESFSLEENEKLAKVILSKFDIKPGIKYHSATQPRLWFSTVESTKLMAIIKPYMHEELLYKIDERKYIEYITSKIR